MAKAITSIYVEAELLEEARKKDLNISQITEETLRKRLFKGLSLKELEELKITHIEALNQLDSQTNNLISEMKAVKQVQTDKELQEIKDYEEEQARKLNIIKDKLKDIPEVKEIDLNQIKNTKYLTDLSTKLNAKYPDLHIGTVQLREYLASLPNP